MLRLLAYSASEKPGRDVFHYQRARRPPVAGFAAPDQILLGHLSALHDKNIRQFTAPMDKIYIFRSPRKLPMIFSPTHTPVGKRIRALVGTND
jgi:hypothetical protein